MLPTPLARAPRPLRRSPRPAALAGAVLAAGLLASALAPAAASANPFATLYKDARHKGGALQVTGDIPQLSAFGFNDATSSARLYGEPLAVFKDADYKGACFTVRGDVPSFNDAGFGNDNLSSVRVHFTCEDGPLDVDACAAAPCAAGQLCVDLPRPAPRSAAGRQCVTWTAPERPRASAPGALDPPNLARSGSAPENLARGRAARQSSTYGTASASLAVDGNANGNFSSGSVTHTQTEPAAWLEVALGEPRAVASVRLHNRTDGSTERILGVYVTLSDVGCDQVAAEPIARSAPIAANAAVHTLSFDGEPRARFVCVRRSTPGPLSLAELEVLAPTRTLPNLARSKAARVVPSYGGHSPALLTDGDTRGSYSAGSVVHTQDTPGNFIEVDLGALREVATVILHNRTDCCGERLSSAVLELSATPCDATPRAPVAALELLHSDYSPIVAAHLPAPASGRYLCLRQAGAVPTNIAEIEAYGPEDERLRLPARARQSSVGLGGTPDRVNDGQTSGHWLHGSVNHTAPASSDAVSGDSAPWVEVDLQATRRVGRVMVYNRTDGSTQRLTGARLELSLDPCNNPARRVVRDEQLTVFNRHERVPPAIGAAGYNAMEAAVREGRVKPFLGGVSPPVQALDFLEAPAARYVCLRHDVAHFLHVAEIEVYEGEPAENLARRPGVATRQLSVAHDGDAARAVDGLRWGNYDAATITHTDGAAGRWWEADLGAPQAIRAVAVFNRTDCCGERLLGAVVEASLDPCDLATRRVVKSLPIPIAPIDNAWIRRPPYATGAGATSRDLPLRRTELSLAGTPAARYVCVRQPRAQALSLAEVEIYGFGTAAPAPPAPVPALADALAATPPVAPPAPPALSATTV